MTCSFALTTACQQRKVATYSPKVYAFPPLQKYLRALSGLRTHLFKIFFLEKIGGLCLVVPHQHPVPSKYFHPSQLTYHIHLDTFILHEPDLSVLPISAKKLLTTHIKI